MDVSCNQFSGTLDDYAYQADVGDNDDSSILRYLNISNNALLGIELIFLKSSQSLPIQQLQFKEAVVLPKFFSSRLQRSGMQTINMILCFLFYVLS